MAAAREWLCKHVPEAMDTHATVKVLLEMGVSTVVCAKRL
jgi:hypothetical protein